ncbi:MAG: hypothetical protein NTV89_02835 [Proteobacteria bacterium]|nr:hypothetical protein [Pseudomonadota bacterium]
MSSNRLTPFCLFSAVVSAGEARGFVGFLPNFELNSSAFSLCLCACCLPAHRSLARRWVASSPFNLFTYRPIHRFTHLLIHLYIILQSEIRIPQSTSHEPQVTRHYLLIKDPFSAKAENRYINAGFTELSFWYIHIDKTKTGFYSLCRQLDLPAITLL